MRRAGPWILVFSVSASGAVSGACAQTRTPAVRPGIDVLLSDSLQLIAGQRIGLITNQTGVDARGVPTMDRLRAAEAAPAVSPPPRLVALFAPEHHFAASLRPGQLFGDTVDPATGLPIYSLYDANRAPTAQELAGLDVLIADMQDVGARPFTYISTIIASMRAARASGKRFIVLDRPNPIGCAMQGPVLDSAYASFIGMLPVPLRHGMTMGELARFANAEMNIGADLVVVPVQGWRRCMWFDETGLPWVKPSPNLPDLAAVAWYPGTVLFEATNLSVGRGTETPFRVVGAPWLDAEFIARDLPLSWHANAATATPESPGDDKYANTTMRAVLLRPQRVRQADVVETALWLMAEIARRHPDSLRVDSVGLARRLGRPFNPRLAAQACSGTWDRCPQRFEAEIEAFRRKVGPFLLYR